MTDEREAAASAESRSTSEWVHLRCPVCGRHSSRPEGAWETEPCSPGGGECIGEMVRESRSTSGAAEYLESVREMCDDANEAWRDYQEDKRASTAIAATLLRCTAAICARLERIEAAIRERPGCRYSGGPAE